MTHISPRASRDMATHFTRMETQARHQLWADRARAVLFAGAMAATAVIIGYLLGCAAATAEALPRITAQAAACAAW